MSQVSLKINGVEVSQNLIRISNLREFSDEDKFFTGFFRKSNLSLTFDNSRSKFKSFGSVFPAERNNSEVKLSYRPNNPNLNDVTLFEGILNEGSTEENLSQHRVKFSILDYTKLLTDEIIEEGDLKAIDNNAFPDKEVLLNKSLITEYLNYFFLKYALDLKFNLSLGSESIFPPADSYYDSNSDVFKTLVQLARSTNSFIFTEGKTLFFNPRSTYGSPVAILRNEILEIDAKTDGWNKVFNSIVINNSEPYRDEASINLYGLRELTITNYEAPNRETANVFLDYYKVPRAELSLKLKLNLRTASLKVGDSISLNIASIQDIESISGGFLIIEKTIDFSDDIVQLRIKKFA